MNGGLVVVNPAAARLRDAPRRERIVRRLVASLAARHGAPPEVLVSGGPEEAMSAVAAAVSADAPCVVGVGGDGTLRDIAAVLAGSGIPLGIVPGGTGNLMAGILGIPGSLEDAIDALADARPRIIDLGRASLRLWPAPDEASVGQGVGAPDSGEDAQGVPPPDRVAPPAGVAGTDPGAAAPRAWEPDGEPGTLETIIAIGGGLGFDARVMATTPADLKRRFGRAAYFARAAILAARIDAVPHRITVDGEVIETDASVAMVLNMGALVPGRVEPRLPVLPDDGLLDVVVVGARGPVHGVRVLLDQLWRTDLGGGSGSDTLRLRGHHVRIESARLEPVQVDGDHVGWGTLEAVVQPGALAVLVRPRTTAGSAGTI